MDRMKLALVTGASSGLGKALAGELRRTGYRVVGVDQNAPKADVVDISILCDLSSRGGLDKVIPSILAAGPYDLVFMNAGISATGKFEELPITAHLDLLRINLEAPIILTNALLNAKSLRGSICFVSSLSHFTGYPGAASYAASKDGLAVYAKSLRKAGIKTTIAYPGPLDTPHAARHAPIGANASKRMKPEVAAKAIVRAAINGKRRVFPSAVAKMLALAGWLFPALMTKTMRKLLYAKMDQSVY
jgi:cyclic-di-GMP-binding biofilm dispersal mediator protein